MLRVGRCLVGALVLLAGTLSFTTKTNADEVATVVFAGVTSSCNIPIGPCTPSGPQETWSGNFTVDLNNGLILSDTIVGVGPGAGPWIGGTPGTFVDPGCLPGGSGCALLWYDAAGWVLQWDPSFHASDMLHSGPGDFFSGAAADPPIVTVELSQSPALQYSVYTPEPATILLFSAGLAGLVAFRSWKAKDQKRQV